MNPDPRKRTFADEVRAGVIISRRLYVVSLAIFLLGVIVSFFARDFGWLSRFGSLIVIVALVAASIDAEKLATAHVSGKDFDTWVEYVNYNERMKVQAKYWDIDEDEDEKSDADSDKNMGAPPLDDEFYNYRRYTADELRGAFIERAKQVRVAMELYIAAFGTFIWGFGDLPNYFFK